MTKPETFIRSYESALATQTWENVAPLIHPDCVATFNDGTYHGIAAVEAAFRRTFALIEDEEYRLSEIRWLKEAEHFAVLTYIFNWSGKIDGKAASGSGRGTSVLVNEGNGWQVLAEHLGPLPVA